MMVDAHIPSFLCALDGLFWLGGFRIGHNSRVILLYPLYRNAVGFFPNFWALTLTTTYKAVSTHQAL